MHGSTTSFASVPVTSSRAVSRIACPASYELGPERGLDCLVAGARSRRSRGDRHLPVGSGGGWRRNRWKSPRWGERCDDLLDQFVDDRRHAFCVDRVVRTGVRCSRQSVGDAGVGRAGRRTETRRVAYVPAQLVGGVAGTALADAMFSQPVFAWSSQPRGGFARLLGEVVSTFGLISVVLICSRTRPSS